jgi:hypothetical protein
MPQVKNHKAQVVIDANELLIIEDLVIEFDIVKDINEEPNEATITIYNLEANKRNQVIDPTYQDIPIDLYLTPHQTGQNDKQEFVLAFRGEIDRVENHFLRPGYSTILHCMSQKEHHKAKYIDSKTYAAGTKYSQIVDDFLAIIDMPSEIVAMPKEGIRKARSFTGPAYELLQQLMYDLGNKVYIQDGILYITSVYEPAIPVYYEISRSVLFEPPLSTVRVDSDDIEMRTIVDTVNLDLFSKERKRKKRFTKIKYGDKGKKKVIRREIQEAPDEGETVTFDAIDAVITGADFHLFADPNIQPDYLVSLTDDTETHYRVREVHMWGDNWGGDWDMTLKCDDFDDYLSNA